MNSILRYTLFLAMTVVIWGGLSSCQEDDMSGGAPMVSFIRITAPESADSLVVSAGQGQMISIMGENLQNVKQLYFNDRPATLNPSFITSSSVIVTVPSKIPSEINNLMTMVFSNGDSLKVPFEVRISAPSVDRFLSEYVNEGDVAVVYGNYFYEPLSVTFSGDVAGEILEVEDDQILVRVPAGAEVGPISVTSKFGTSKSKVYFRDDRNIIADFDGSLANWVWQGSSWVVDSDPEISNINDKFIRVNRGAQPAGPYIEFYGGSKEEGSDIAAVTKNIPEDAFVNPGNYSLKFELNTLESLVGAVMWIYLGDANNGDLGSARGTNYEWKSNEDTGGEWATISIPWNEVYEANQRFAYDPTGYAMFLIFNGPSAATYNIGMDNFRVVPN
ncbi:IPT/TIG domain-containing protein [Gilvimarinus agarilyticus]|nr:IPT/TIG domain-containing protein [Gilvimarinus agarilyticus]